MGEHLDLGVILDNGSYLCDGCNVREPHEHRCHHGDGSWTDPRAVCACPECVPTLPFGTPAIGLGGAS